MEEERTLNFREFDRAKWIARKNPNHEIWKYASWIDVDATTCALLHPDGNILIYWPGPDYEKNILLSSHVLHRLEILKLKAKSKFHSNPCPS